MTWFFGVDVLLTLTDPRVTVSWSPNTEYVDCSPLSITVPRVVTIVAPLVADFSGAHIAKLPRGTVIRTNPIHDCPVGVFSRLKLSNVMTDVSPIKSPCPFGKSADREDFVSVVMVAGRVIGYDVLGCNTVEPV